MNEHGNELQKSSTSAMTDIVASGETAEVQAMVVAAKRFPRDELVSRDKVVAACKRPGMAAVATYEYAKGGTEVTGPSIRFAEEMARTWGNMSHGIREVEKTRTESTLEAYCWDMETNVRSSMSFTVPHERHTKSGVKKLTDPRDIYENNMNQGKRRLRACILQHIPGDIIEDAMNECDATMRKSANTSPEAVGKLVQAFAKHGITLSMIEEKIQRNISTITPAQVVRLIKIGNSVRDGMSGPETWFDIPKGTVMPTGGSKTDAIKAAMQNQKAPEQAAPIPPDLSDRGEVDMPEPVDPGEPPF